MHETFTIDFLDRKASTIFRVDVHVLEDLKPLTRRLIKFFKGRLKPVRRFFVIIIKNKSTFSVKLHDDP